MSSPNTKDISEKLEKSQHFEENVQDEFLRDFERSKKRKIVVTIDFVAKESQILEKESLFDSNQSPM
jgi:hypothetical protein